MSTKRILFGVVTIIFVVLTIEVLSFVAYSELLKNLDSINQSFDKNEGCVDVISSSELHLFLGTIYKPNSGCLHKKVNKQGFMSREYSFKDKDEFHNILILGGSVAEEFYIYKSNDDSLPISYFEKYLNDNYSNPQQKPFRVFSGARIDYRQPHQLLMLSFLGSSMDTVINIEGYNETHGITLGSLMPPPTQEFIVHHNKTELLKILSLRDKVRSSWLGKNTYLGKLIYRYTVNRSFEKIDELDQLGWSKRNEIRVFNEKDAIGQYKGYLKAQGGICKSYNLNCFSFLQPIPQLYKNLTSQEYKDSVIPGQSKHEWDDVGRLYREIEQDVYKKEIEGIKLYSLVNIFSEVEKRVYRDIIHFYEYPENDVADGYDLLIKSVVARLEKEKIIVKKTQP